MKSKAFPPRQKMPHGKHRKVGDYLVPERLVDLDERDSLTLDECREALLAEQGVIPDFTSEVDGWVSGVYALPFADLIPIWSIRQKIWRGRRWQSRLPDVEWCYYTAMTLELPSWRVDQLLHRRDERFRPYEAMRVYEAAQGLMEDCGLN